MRVHVGEAHSDGSGHWIIAKRVEHDDGMVEEGVFILPEDVLEWRAAEYGIDPSDLDTLFDLVIAEFFIQPDDGDGPTLFETDDVDEARQAHLQRVSRAKWRHRISTRSKDHPATPVKGQFVMDDEALDLKRQIVQKRRQQARRQENAVMLSLVDGARAKRIEDLRRTLEN